MVVAAVVVVVAVVLDMQAHDATVWGTNLFQDGFGTVFGWNASYVERVVIDVAIVVAAAAAADVAASSCGSASNSSRRID